MPFTTLFCIIGAASISAFPLFSGFIAKSLTLSAVAYEGYLAVWMILLFASAGVFHHSGIKIPYFAFFAHDSGKRCKEAPLNMLIAMGVTAFLCIAIGVYSPWLYSLLPYPVEYEPYTTSHVIGQYQLLMFSALAFAVLMRFKIYPPELKSVNLDFDITYRKWLPVIYRWIIHLTRDGWHSILKDLRRGVHWVIVYMFRHHGPEGILARTWPTGSMALWVALLLGGFLLIYYL
jgi:multicomponent Na+:H+ antiporter subunit D